MNRLRLTLLSLVLSLSLFSQSTGRINGTIEDASGAIVAGASVTCSNTQTGQSRVV